MEMTSQNEQGLPNTQLGLTSESVIYLQKIANWTTFFFGGRFYIYRIDDYSGSGYDHLFVNRFCCSG